MNLLAKSHKIQLLAQQIEPYERMSMTLRWMDVCWLWVAYEFIIYKLQRIQIQTQIILPFASSIRNEPPSTRSCLHRKCISVYRTCAALNEYNADDQKIQLIIQPVKFNRH